MVQDIKGQKGKTGIVQEKSVLHPAKKPWFQLCL